MDWKQNRSTEILHQSPHSFPAPNILKIEIHPT